MPGLTIRFGEVAARVNCADPLIGPLLERYFRHCGHSGEEEPAGLRAEVEFSVWAAPGGWDLWRGSLFRARREHPYMVLEFFMNDLVEALITASQRQPVFHAAGVSQGGKALLMCGASGAGKSSLAAWLVSQGWDYLSDEIVALEAGGSRLWGLPRPLILKRGLGSIWRAWLHGDLDALHDPFSDGLAWVDPDAIRRGSALQTAGTAGLVFPTYRAGADFQVERLTGGEAAFRLMHHLANRANLADGGLPAVAGLARALPAFSLQYGDLNEAVWSWFNSTADHLPERKPFEI
jgi:hypothetical protein